MTGTLKKGRELKKIFTNYEMSESQGLMWDLQKEMINVCFCQVALGYGQGLSSHLFKYGFFLEWKVEKLCSLSNFKGKKLF